MRLLAEELSSSQTSTFSRLPPELVNAIVDMTDGLMTRAEAEDYRLQLMNERGVMAKNNTQEMFEISFSMCEH